MAESLVLHGIAGLKVLSSINRVPDGMGPEVEEALTQNLSTFIEMRNQMKTTVGWKRSGQAGRPGINSSTSVK